MWKCDKVIKRVVVLLMLACLIPTVYAQDTIRQEVRPVQYYLGFQPDFTIIPFDEYDRYAFDINILPFTLEFAINPHWAIRLHSIWDLQLRPAEFPDVFSNAGIEITVPYYLARKNSEEGHRGLYLGGLVTPVYHSLNEYYSISLGAEAGYSFLFGNKWSIAIAAQAGLEFQINPKTHFTRINPYTNPRISIGFWL
jgi:hypothetical protein